MGRRMSKSEWKVYKYRSNKARSRGTQLHTNTLQRSGPYYPNVNKSLGMSNTRKFKRVRTVNTSAPAFISTMRKEQLYQRHQEEWVREHYLTRGDDVKIVCKIEVYEGWDNVWTDTMDELLGAMGIVSEIGSFSEGIMIVFSNGQIASFPYFCLEVHNADKYYEDLGDVSL